MILHVRWGGYLQIRQVLTQRFPELQVDGSNYPPPPNKVLVAQLTQAGMFGTIGFTLLGNKLFEMLGSPPPALYFSLANNKMPTCLGAWFLGNTIAQNMLSTGAFEVYYDGQIIFSKLKTGRLPQVAGIVRDMEKAIKEAAGRGKKAKLPSNAGDGLEATVEEDLL